MINCSKFGAQTAREAKEQRYKSIDCLIEYHVNKNGDRRNIIKLIQSQPDEWQQLRKQRIERLLRRNLR